MEPVYMAENKYSYLVGSYRRATTDSYQAQSPENSFEDTVQSLFLQGQEHLQHEEYNLALSAFRELMSLILHTAHPQMPIDPNRFQVEFPLDLSLIDVLCAKSASVLTAMPVVTYDAVLRHETGHTLAVAAFGTAFGIADLIGENVVGAGAGDYGEQIAESHANRPGRPTIPMWG